MCRFHRDTCAHGKDTNLPKHVGLQIAVPALQMHHNLTLFWCKQMAKKKKKKECQLFSVTERHSGLASFVGRQLLKKSCHNGQPGILIR